MASVQIKGRDSLKATTLLVHAYSNLIGFNLEPDVPETCRVIDPLIMTPRRLTNFIMAWASGQKLEFYVREDVPPADSEEGVTGTEIV